MQHRRQQQPMPEKVKSRTTKLISKLAESFNYRNDPTTSILELNVQIFAHTQYNKTLCRTTLQLSNLVKSSLITQMMRQKTFFQRFDRLCWGYVLSIFVRANETFAKKFSVPQVSY